MLVSYLIQLSFGRPVYYLYHHHYDSTSSLSVCLSLSLSFSLSLPPSFSPSPSFLFQSVMSRLFESILYGTQTYDLGFIVFLTLPVSTA